MEKLENPWRGFALLVFMFTIGTLICFWVLKFVGAAGVVIHPVSGDPISFLVHPLVNVFIICVVIVTFFVVIAFGSWPWHKMSLAARGFLSLLSAYLIMLVLWRLFNFDMINVPGILAGNQLLTVPFYSTGGDFALISGINPSGPLPWAGLLCFMFWMVVFLFVFVHLGMWPISKFKSLMVQPIMGIVLFILCFALALGAYGVGVWAMKLEPIYFMIVGISFAFGMLGILFMFQMWPGRLWKPPTMGFVNLLLAVVIGIAAYYGIKGFCNVIFVAAGANTSIVGGVGAMGWPLGYFAMANVMLALTFPMWAIYQPFFDFWPMRPTPGPPG